jgi:RNA polymerase sigma-70 factor (ECF subfamily)
LDDRVHEAQLVLLAQAGDREALETLLKGVQPVLFKYIRRLVGADSAEDILQDVFLEICRHLRALQEPQFFRAWAYRISTRASFRFLRSRRLWLDRHEEEIQLDELPTYEEKDAAFLRAELHSLLDTISPASRAVMVLHYFEDLTLQEVAAILQLGPGTVRSRLAYGLKCLRTATEGKGEFHGRSI